MHKLITQGNIALRRLIALSFLVLMVTGFASAQTNCTANAGGNTITCGTTTTLTGTVNGTLGTLNSPLWTYVEGSGPVTPTIVSPNNLVTQVTGMTQDGAYRFRLTRTCGQGTAVSDVVITAHPRSNFTAGPDMSGTCASVGTAQLNGIIPAGFTGVWRLEGLAGGGSNAQLSSTTSATPTLSLIEKVIHKEDPTYRAILTITSTDRLCTYVDTAIVRFVPNTQIILNPVTTTTCAPAGGNTNQFDVGFTGQSPRFNTGSGAAGSPAFGTTVSSTAITQPAGANLAFLSIGNGTLQMTGMTKPGEYKFTITTSNACAGSYTTPIITYNVSGTRTPYALIQTRGPLTAPEHGTSWKHFCKDKAGTTSPETFYFSIDSRDDSNLIPTVSATAPPGAAKPTVSVTTGNGAWDRVLTVTPPSGGWSVGSYGIGAVVSYSGGDCKQITGFDIHISDNGRTNLFIPDASTCMNGATDPVSATTTLPPIFYGTDGNYLTFTDPAQYSLSVISKPAGSGNPIYSSTYITRNSLTISNLTMPGDYVFRAGYTYTGVSRDIYLQEWACSGVTKLVDTFVVHVENLINANAGSDQNLSCVNSVALQGNSPGTGTGLWTGAGSPNGSSPVITTTSNPQSGVTGITVPGTYSFNWNITSLYGGCVANDQVVFQIASIPPAAPTVTATQPATCSGTLGTITVIAPLGAEYEYSIDGINYQAGTTFSNLAPGSYQVTSRTTCTSTATTAIIKTNICGTVFNDPNGNMVLDGGEAGTNAGSANLTVYLVSHDTVVSSSVVAPDGSYSLNGAAKDSVYRVVLSNTAGILAGNPITALLPTGWVNTGERFGSNNGAGTGYEVLTPGVIAVTPTGLVSAVNFGIEEPPTAGRGASTAANPGGTNQLTVPPAAFTNIAKSTDPSSSPNGVVSIRITTLPTGATSIVINGTSYGTGFTSFPTAGIVVPADANGNPTQVIRVDPDGAGATTVTIPFVAVDAAGKESLNTGTVVIDFTQVVAVPDLTPVIDLPLNTFVANETKNLVVYLEEVNGGETLTGVTLLSLTVPGGYELQPFNTGLTTSTPSGGGSTPVSNNEWDVLSQDGNQILLKAKAGVKIDAYGVKFIGFALKRTTSITQAVSNMTVDIIPDAKNRYDSNTWNNTYSRFTVSN